MITVIMRPCQFLFFFLVRSNLLPLSLLTHMLPPLLFSCNLLLRLQSSPWQGCQPWSQRDPCIYPSSSSASSSYSLPPSLSPSFLVEKKPACKAHKHTHLCIHLPPSLHPSLLSQHPVLCAHAARANRSSACNRFSQRPAPTQIKRDHGL